MFVVEYKSIRTDKCHYGSPGDDRQTNSLLICVMWLILRNKIVYITASLRARSTRSCDYLSGRFIAGLHSGQAAGKSHRHNIRSQRLRCRLNRDLSLILTRPCADWCPKLTDPLPSLSASLAGPCCRANSLLVNSLNAVVNFLLIFQCLWFCSVVLIISSSLSSTSCIYYSRIQPELRTRT